MGQDRRIWVERVVIKGCNFSGVSKQQSAMYRAEVSEISISQEKKMEREYQEKLPQRFG